MSLIPAADWLGAALSGVDELAMISLGSDPAARLAGEAAPAHPVVESRLPIESDEQRVCLTLVATPDGCACLARAFLKLEPGEELLAEHAGDALNEILNIIGGVVKRELVVREPSVRLGLPKHFAPGSQARVETSADLRLLGNIDLRLSVLEEK